MIWIATATPWESGPLKARLGASGHILEMGMGAENARRSLDAAFARHGAPEWLIHTGFAGATQPGVASGTLLFDVWGEDAEARELAKRVASELGLAYQLGPIRSADRVLATRAEKEAFGRTRRALAVDLENEAVREWARARKVPSLAVKAVFDELEQELPLDTPASAGAADSAAYLAKHWRDLPLLVSLWRRQRRSMLTLTTFLGAFLAQLPEPASL